MTAHLNDFAHLCANVIADVAAHLDAGEALASVEHTVTALRGPYRYAGQAVARALYAVARYEERPDLCAIEDCLRWLRLSASWARMGDCRSVWVSVGVDIERASSVVDAMPVGQRELRELLRCVIAAVRVSVEGVRHAA